MGAVSTRSPFGKVVRSKTLIVRPLSFVDVGTGSMV